MWTIIIVDEFAGAFLTFVSWPKRPLFGFIETCQQQRKASSPQQHLPLLLVILLVVGTSSLQIAEIFNIDEQIFARSYLSSLFPLIVLRSQCLLAPAAYTWSILPCCIRIWVTVFESGFFAINSMKWTFHYLLNSLFATCFQTILHSHSKSNCSRSLFRRVHIYSHAITKLGCA